MRERLARTETQIQSIEKYIEDITSDQEKFYDKLTSKFELSQKALSGLTISINENQSNISHLQDSVSTLTNSFSSLKSELSNLIRDKVRPPMSSKDRAVLYGTAITAICSLLGTLAVVFFG